MTKKTLLFFVSLLFVATMCFPQAGTTGAINGTVIDPDGAALPGITVILKSPKLIVEKMTTVSNSQGHYRFLNLPPGTFEVTYILEGMNTMIHKGIIVSIGRTVSLDVKMQLKSVEEKVIVSGQAPTVDRQSTSGSASMDVEFLKAIPSSGRGMDDYFNMAPGVTENVAHGSAVIGNSYNLDGVNLGDAATGTQGVYFGVDIMEEMNVQTGGLPAEYGSVQGAMVNVVSKSGGNKMSGSASFYLDHEDFQSKNAGGTSLESNKVGAKLQYEPVLTLGGPLLKNKLWFFMNASMRITEEYVSGYPADKSEEVAPNKKKYFPYFKLTYAPNQKDKFVLSYNFYDSRNDHRFANKYHYEDATSNQTNATHTFNFHWTHLFNDNLFVNLKGAFVRRDYLIQAKQDVPYYRDYYTNIRSGGYWRNHDDYGRDRNQVNFDATTFLDNLAGTHEIKFGAEFSQFNSAWYVKGIPDSITGACYNFMDGEDYIFGLKLIGEVDRKEIVQNLHFFIQDTWSISKHLTLNLGLRLESNSMYWPKQGLGIDETYDTLTVNRSVDEKTKAYGWTNIVPRLGAIFDVFADGTTLIKASFGRMVIPNQLGFVNLAHPNGWFGVQEYYNPDGSFDFWIPWAIPGASAQVGHPNYDLKAAYTDELTIGVERELWEDWSVGARYIKKWDKDLITIVDAAQLDLDKLMQTGELDWSKNWTRETVTFNGTDYSYWNQIDKTATEGYILNPPGADRTYDGVEITLKKRYSKGWSIFASYVFGKSEGLVDTERGSESLGTSDLFQNPNYHINNIGRFHLERRHMFKLQGLFKGPLGINLSGYLRAMSGQRETPRVRTEDLGLSPNQGTDEFFIEPKGSWGYPSEVTLDLRLEKSFQVKNFNLSVFVDCFNVFNSNVVTEVYNFSSNSTIAFGDTEEIQDPRIFRFGARIEFK
ncbi:MAG: TonB-dependent receptor [bacterium]|nr:TonB-dependent receptor [bacterium]